ncbi:MAG: type I-F CRISPR-associated helicase Cas3 [Gammaproteobacteria bacterium]|nr:type I-F CRISPR-associated helicase Cas3 [Gammaproteobacteria bacterium]
MMVTFVSQCEKNAIKKTRRVLDAFANRIGDNTWQTVITQEGLGAVKKLLRKSASKSTAVSCHWIRSRARSELVWVVGKRDAFNFEGVVPVNSTKNMNYKNEENNWQYLPLIQSLSAIAALFHDWGKASDLFQEKLAPKSEHKFKGDPIRHEWVSCLLLSQFIKQSGTQLVTQQGDNSGEQWLTLLSDSDIDEQALLSSIDKNDIATSSPFTQLSPIAELVMWLIVSHHRLPNLPRTTPTGELTPQVASYYKGEKRSEIRGLLALVSKEWGYENRYDETEYQARVRKCFEFNHGLLTQAKKWRGEVKKWATKLNNQQVLAKQSISDGSIRVVLHHARLCLMLGDHYYSSQEAAKNWSDDAGLYANTDRDSGKLKQKLDEHLYGVTKAALQNAYYLPCFENELPSAEDINSLKKPSPKKFAWQDKAVTAITQWRTEYTQTQFGFFAVNMASTGQGKTFANAKIMRALSSDANSLRYTLALGLRTLTLQTGDEYRERIGLDDSELAVLIGSSAVLELHNSNKKITDEKAITNLGSESAETLLDEDIDFDCDVPDKGLITVLTNERDRKFLYAPVLSCTIDHLMSATECVRGGRYILPSLRMMSADLVIDEIDDFSGDDLVAIGRLIHFAGLMGRKVMISSATIPPDLAEGYFKAYRDGYLLFAASRNIPPLIGCAWSDEFKTAVSTHNQATLSDAIKGYREQHAIFVDKRIKKLAKEVAKRKARIVDVDRVLKAEIDLSQNLDERNKSKQSLYFNIMAKTTSELHKTHHTKDIKTGIDVSFGVIRVANINPCVDLTRYLLSDYSPANDTQIRVLCYHSQQTLLLRSEQEKHLDEVLKRKENIGKAPAAFLHKVIRQHLDTIKCDVDSKNAGNNKIAISNVIFILVATPVEEVGRDHDFDWAIVEPSSYRSIIQLAGRVRRHRDGEAACPNIAIMARNLKSVKNDGVSNTKVQSINDALVEEPCFEKPGYETNKLLLNSHDLKQLLNEKDINMRLDAAPRIQKEAHQQSGYLRGLGSSLGGISAPKSLAELEHASIWKLLANYASKDNSKSSIKAEVGPNTFQGYLRESWWLTGLPQTFFRFRAGDAGIKTYLTYLHEQHAYKFCEKDEQGFAIDRQLPLGIRFETLSECAQQRLWLTRHYEQSVKQKASEQEVSLRRVCLKYGELNFRHQEGKQYYYNDQFGLVKE